MKNLNPKKFFLYLLITSVAVSALLGIGVMLFGDFGELESKILITTSTVTYASILGLACGAYLEKTGARILPLCGIVFAILSAVLWITFVWNDVGNENVFVRVALSATLLAVSSSLVSLLSIARLGRKFLWSRYALHASVWTLSAILIVVIWSQSNSFPDYLSRTIGVLSIIVAALTIVTPIFHWLSGQKTETEEIDAEIARLKARIEELETQKANASGAQAAV